MNDAPHAPKREKGQPLMMRLPVEMVRRLMAEAERRAVPMATAARQMLKERLDQIDREER